MVASVGDLDLIPVQATASINASGVAVSQEGTALLFCNAVFGGSGAVSSYTGSPGVTFTKPAGTGLYRVTVPGAKAVYLVGASYIDAAGHANTHVCPKSKVASTGVIDLTVAKETASTNTVFQAANADSGDSMDVVIAAEW